MSAPPASRRFVRRLVGPLLFVLSVVAVGALAVVPTRTFINQKKATAEAETRLSTLRDTNARLQQELDALNDDVELERVARQQYGFVKPGEEVYRIIEPPKPPVAVPGVWPFEDLRKRLNATDVGGAAPAPPPSTTTTTTGSASATRSGPH
ncbi:MAG: septum formation initiator family protein [Acidimicrobiales bacterium]